MKIGTRNRRGTGNPGGYPISWWQAITRRPRCELCNSRAHRSWECWLLNHRQYIGFLHGATHGREDLRKEMQKTFGMQPRDPSNQIQRIQRAAFRDAYPEEARTR